MSKRPVTERDFRMPEFADANPAEYEFRADGKIVRKDRWERAINSIRFLVGIDGREYEIDDVINRVRQMATMSESIYQAVGDALWNELKSNASW